MQHVLGSFKTNILYKKAALNGVEAFQHTKLPKEASKEAKSVASYTSSHFTIKLK